MTVHLLFHLKTIHHQVEFLPLDYNRFAFDVNYFGPLAVTKAFLPLIRENKGRIVNVSRQVAGLAPTSLSC